MAERMNELDDDVLVNPTSDEWRVAAFSHRGDAGYLLVRKRL